jgi:RHS repeat-associated protein
MIRQYVIAVTLGLCAAAALFGSASLRAGQQPPVSGSPPSVPPGAGRTETRLPDGRLLLIGGQGPSGPESGLSVFDPGTQTSVRLHARLREGRAWHTATILPTGAILVAGGIGVDGRAVATAERFDLATETLTPIDVPGAAARARHTATLLTDGRVLLVGGHDGAGGPVADSEVWDVETPQTRQIASLQPRLDHRAALLADGRVRISGGAAVDDIFDPRSERGRPATGPFVEPSGSALIAESEPRNNARDVTLDARITLRFSRQVDPATVTPQSVILSGPDGPLSTLMVVAESGRLTFVWPSDRLEPDTAYRLDLANLRDLTGALLPAAQLTFTTIKLPKETRSDDEEIWKPDLSDPSTWETHRPPSPWQSLPALEAEPGVTAVAGQVLTLDGRPLRGVTLAIDSDATRTDNTGRFLLRLAHGEAFRREMGIDGSTANRADKVYGFFEYGLTVSAGTTTVLPFTIWMPRLDVTHEVTIPSPTTAETVITTPYVPGLELHLPPRTIVRDEAGKPVTRLGITPIPVDRPPFPLAKNIDVPVYFTVQPGSAYVRSYGAGGSGAWVVYPNYRRTSAPGQVLQFFHYDPEEKDWYVYGLGTVTPDGTQVVPDANTRLYEFTGAMLQTGDPVPGGGWTPGGPGWGDPVDPSTGVFGLHKTDLYLPDVIPLSLTRTYNSADSAVARPFGRGMTHPYAMFLWSAQQWQQADLILPEGGRVHYVRTSPGTSWTDAVFVHQETQTTSATPTAWYKSVITWNGNGWNLQRKDGMVFVFGENAPLQGIRDRHGNALTITRTNGQAGNITRITSPHGRWIAFTYDSSNHVTQATDNIGRTVRYTYNASGNLATVTDAENGVTTYAWTPSNQVATMTDPRGIVFLSNTYTNGRVTAQAAGDGASTTQFAYTLGASGAITQTDITDPRGHRERLLFNNDHYIVSDVRAVGQPEQQTIAIERQPGANFTTATVDGLGRRTEFQVDAFGHVVRATRLAGTSNATSTVISYEAPFSQPASFVDPMGHTWTLDYDASGNLASVTDPVGRRTTTTVRSQRTTRDGDESASADVAVRLPRGRPGERHGSPGGDLERLLRRRRPARRRHRSSWTHRAICLEPCQPVTAATDAMGGHSSWSHDGNGNTLEFSDTLGHVTKYAYDAFDRVVSRTDPLSQTESQQYDANDNPMRTVDRKGQPTTYQYDALGRLTLVTFADASTIGYTYDAGDRLTQMADSANGTLTWQYDLLDRVVQESTPSGTVSYAYDADGRRTAMTVTGQPVVSYAYDDSHRLTSVSQGNTAAAVAYDGAGRRQSMTFPNGIVAGYTYDAADRVTALAYSLGNTPIGHLTYEYDAAGNRTATDGTLSRTGLPAAVPGATYDAANRIIERAGIPFAHDPNGNLTNDGLHAFQWNARDLLTSMTGGVAGVFQYDAMGRRRAKTVAGTTTRFLYDGLSIVQEQNAGGVALANVLGGLRLDETIMRSDGGGAVVLADVLGSTLGLADATGTLSTQYTYAPFGATTTTGAASANAAQFTGRENDGTGLYYYRARYYAPDLGRFISEDPLEFGGGDENLYAYVGNRPTGANDPLGLYNRDVHFDLTDAIGRQVGMCTANAIRIAAADQGVDEDPWTRPTALLNLDARSWYHFTTPEALASLRRRAFESGKLGKMGVYLHAFQDSFAHQAGPKDRDGQRYGPVVGHAFQWHGPDNPRNRPDLWRRMAAATASELFQFHQQYPTCQAEWW